jgi:glycosyltransferase involved in cell wall biosynthesis
MAKIAIVLNSSWNIYNFRLPLLKYLENQGHEVIAIAPVDEYTKKIPYEFHPIRIKSRSLNPLQHFAVIIRFIKIFRKVKPDIALLYTIQPNTHGNIAAYLTGVKTISNIAGLGNLYIEKKFTTRIATTLYKFALKHPMKVFFQNNIDMDMFIEQSLVDVEKSERIPGSGVDIERFSPKAVQKNSSEPFVFLLASRMLWDKGVAEFAEAAKLVKKEQENLIFRLVGPLNADNPAALTTQDMDRITANGALEYMGASDQMEDVIADADCVVLPTYYREGLPRVLLEAAAMGKPIISTDAAGCKDVVEHGENGLICKSRNAEDLALQMMRLLHMNSRNRERLGERGRQKVVSQFAQELVFDAYKEAVNSIC